MSVARTVIAGLLFAAGACSAAEAGGGKLGFGFPLGSFNATPAGKSAETSRIGRNKAAQHAARKAQRKQIAKADPAPKIEPAGVHAARPVDAASPSTDAASSNAETAEKATCTKFVPAVGTTVAVECNE